MSGSIPGTRLRAAALLASVSLLATLVLPALASAAGYVALGDSYSSGVGTGTYYAGSGGCHRSSKAYPLLVASRLGASLSFSACSGANTADLLNDQLGPLNASTSYVTISIGGNDAGFSSLITSCALPWPWSCDRDIADARSYVRETLPGQLDDVYSTISSRAPDARVAVVGYPRPFNGQGCIGSTFFSPSEESQLNRAADLLATIESRRASAYGFRFVDPRKAFTGHAVCDEVEWLNGLSWPLIESFHPNVAGQASGYAPLVYAALR